jgi:hypothetical protein
MKKLFLVTVEIVGTPVRTAYRLNAANHTEAKEKAHKIASRNGNRIAVLSVGELQ